MYIPPADRSVGEAEWRPFVLSQGFGQLVAGGRDRDVPVVVPTQFLLEGDEVLLHLHGRNPVFGALAEHPRVVLSVAGDWAYVPSAWKAIEGEDPELGIPTTYYGAVQLVGTATVVSDPDQVAGILRRQLAALQPGVAVADPAVVHRTRLEVIRGIRITVGEVRAKFKFGGNLDGPHRAAVIGRLLGRDGPGDRAAAAHSERRDPPG